MMKNHHIVRVTIRGYQLLQSCDNRAEAVKYLAGQSIRSGAVIYRDGTTGKRYTHNQALAMNSEVTA
jgi:hypothetical protein